LKKDLLLHCNYFVVFKVDHSCFRP